jgi:perosamine synthetase
MESDRIPAAKPTITHLEAKYVQQAIESGQVSLGDFNTSLEKIIGEFYSGSKCLLVTNGTDALYLALLAIGIAPGDEVIVPNLTFIAVANAVKYCGATPVFCEVDIANWCIDIKKIEALVTDRTKAIIIVNSYGGTIDWNDFEPIRSRISLPIIEDNAEGILGTYRKKQLGTFGDISTLSFYGNKLITSGEGGAVITSNNSLFEKMKLIRGQGMDPLRRFFFPVIGHNFRMTNLQAALLSAQWARKDEIFSLLTSHAIYYEELLSQLIENGDILLQKLPNESIRSPWYFTILFQKIDAKIAAQYLIERGVETRPLFIPLTGMPPYFDLKSVTKFEVSHRLHNEGLSLPLFYDLTSDQIRHICHSLIEVIDERK